MSAAAGPLDDARAGGEEAAAGDGRGLHSWPPCSACDEEPTAGVGAAHGGCPPTTPLNFRGSPTLGPGMETSKRSDRDSALLVVAGLAALMWAVEIVDLAAGDLDSHG